MHFLFLFLISLFFCSPISLSVLPALSWLCSLLLLAPPEQRGKQLGGRWMPRAYTKFCGQLTHRASASPSPCGHSYSCCIFSQFTSSPSRSIQHLRCSPTTLPLQSHLKLPEVPKNNIPWHQWFRGSAVLSRRHVSAFVFTSFINYSKSTM